MKVYFGHSKKINYQEFYNAFLKSELSKNYEFIFPHAKDYNNRNGRAFYNKENIDIFLAEVSSPATGLGIELGFAYDEKIPIYCFHQENCHVNNSLYTITDNIIEYKNIEDFLIKVTNILK